MKAEAHNHATTSNTEQVFRTFVGDTVKGVFRYYEEQEFHVLIFECGWGLVFCSAGSYWTATPEEVERQLRNVRQELIEQTDALKNVLAIAGERKRNGGTQ